MSNDTISISISNSAFGLFKVGGYLLVKSSKVTHKIVNITENELTIKPLNKIEIFVFYFNDFVKNIIELLTRTSR